MSPAEILWRARSEVRDAVDRVRIPLGFVPRLPGETLPGFPRGFRTTDVVPGAWAAGSDDPQIHGWSERLKIRADELMENRLTFFNLEKVFLGDPIDWNRDHESGKPRPADYPKGSTTGISR
jgi:hypothetical protein